MVEREGKVLVVHRVRHDDWSLPKGKLEEGESWEEAAAREVEEETGLRCVVGAEVGRTHYDVPAGPKEVRYYRMRASGDARPQNEVDEVRWVTPGEAEQLLDHDRDRELVRSALGSSEQEPG